MESNWIDPGTGPGYSPDDERAPVVKPDDMPLLPSEEQVTDETTDNNDAKRWPELRSAQDVAAEQ